MIRPGRLTTYAALAALTIPCGIAVHLFAEIAGLGYQRGEALLFSGLHLYLVALLVLSPVGLLAMLRRVHATHTRESISRIAKSLPFQGKGVQFGALLFTLQFGFFLATQWGEGCPLLAGHLGMGLLAAVVASSAGSFAVSLCKNDLLLIAAEFFVLLGLFAANGCSVRVYRYADARESLRCSRAFLRTAANLSPPSSPAT